ncbi:MAG TPA: leucyl/phenylalanyl-tRNA--protein transferase, partial [Spirochaetales bacterium]|nr:leucyl/phenylalanyl-tRNA--protein transferase [Spirochaetales bacterium]
DGTWIQDDMVDAYETLHELGYAHSAEAWLDGELVGGLYGIALGRVFFGESMFSQKDDASKAAFIPLVLRLIDEGFSLVDSQVYTDHVAKLGGVELPRSAYLETLGLALLQPQRLGNWSTLFPGFPSSTGYDRLMAASMSRAAIAPNP